MTLKSISNLKPSDEVAPSFHGKIKQFDVFASPSEKGYIVTIGLLLDDESNRCHWIANREIETQNREDLERSIEEIIIEYGYSAEQLLDIHNYVNIDNSIEKLEPADSFVSENIERIKRELSRRTINKALYKTLMSAYRQARNLVLINMELDDSPAYQQFLTERLKYIDLQFDIKNLFSKSLDKYHMDSYHVWVIDRAIHKMNLSPERASELALKLSSGDSYKELKKNHVNKLEKNKAFYLSILAGFSQ